VGHRTFRRRGRRRRRRAHRHFLALFSRSAAQRRRPRALLSLVFALSGCSVADIDFRGKRCQSDAACGSLVCTQGICDQTPLEFPLRVAIYNLEQPPTGGSRFAPSLGTYRSDDPKVIAAHLDAFDYAKIRAGIVDYDGIAALNGQRLTKLLQGSERSAVRWAAHFEPEAESDPTPTQIRAAVDAIRDTYAAHPNYLKLQNRFAVFVRFGAGDDCASAQRWKDASLSDAYVVLKVFSGYRNCAAQPDGWLQTGATSRTDAQDLYSFAISPGFWRTDEPSPRLPRDRSLWPDQVAQLSASGAAFQLLTSFNDWGDGTAIESAQEWSSPSGYGTYLDALHEK
jgi:hypothetical protein